jgi:hypothetical protein
LLELDASLVAVASAIGSPELPVSPPVVVDVAVEAPLVAAPSVDTDTLTDPVAPEAPLPPEVAVFVTDTEPEAPESPEWPVVPEVAVADGSHVMIIVTWASTARLFTSHLAIAVEAPESPESPE